MHLLRTVTPPRLAKATAIQHDKEVCTTFESINYKLLDRKYQQLALSIKQGGFGLVTATETYSFAFLGALASTLRDLANRKEKLETTCSKLSDDFEMGLTLIFSDLRQALLNLHHAD